MTSWSMSVEFKGYVISALFLKFGCMDTKISKLSPDYCPLDPTPERDRELGFPKVTLPYDIKEGQGERLVRLYLVRS